MIYNFDVQYFACQTCASKTKCEECASNLVSTVLKTGKVSKMELNITKGKTSLETDLSEDDVLDLLETYSLFEA